MLLRYAGIIDGDNRTVRVSFQFQQTVIAAAAALHDEKKCEAGPQIENARTESVAELPVLVLVLLVFCC